MPKYTTATIVKNRINNKTTLSDAQVETIIDYCEGYLDTIMKIPSTFTFGAATIRHLVIRRAATDLAVLYILGSMSLSSMTLDYATFAADIAFASLSATMQQLKDQDYVNYIING